MAKITATPNLPASSRMQMPTTGGNLSKEISKYGGMKNGKATASIKQGGVASKITSTAKGKTGMKGSNPYS
jgi:hypothetical protein